MRQGGEEFTVQGLTGVDLSLQIAGPGSRSYAFLIDWHIRLLMALAWLAVGMISASGGLRLQRGAGAWIVALVVGPPILIYLLYHPTVELMMRGQTPGKRMAGVRIVNREGGPPGVGAILVRNAFRLIDSMPVFYLVGLVSTFVTDQRLRIGDMAAGTLLIQSDTETSRTMDRLASRSNVQGLEPAALDLIDQLLERWHQMDRDRRGAIARSLLQRIDLNPPQALAEMGDAELRARLLAVSGSGEPRQ
ncbi:MAG: RDD family protein [Steroidobacteraceae bacterium]